MIALSIYMTVTKKIERFNQCLVRDHRSIVGKYVGGGVRERGFGEVLGEKQK